MNWKKGIFFTLQNFAVIFADCRCSNESQVESEFSIYRERSIVSGVGNICANNRSNKIFSWADVWFMISIHVKCLRPPLDWYLHNNEYSLYDVVFLTSEFSLRLFAFCGSTKVSLYDTHDRSMVGKKYMKKSFEKLQFHLEGIKCDRAKEKNVALTIFDWNKREKNCVVHSIPFWAFHFIPSKVTGERRLRRLTKCIATRSS